MIKIKVYWDLIIILNFSLDFILLMALSIVLKRNVTIKRLLMGGIVGGLSVFILFINMNGLLIFLTKFVVCILMVLISFGYKNIKYLLTNIIYLFMLSVILGGFLYFLRIQFSYKNDGLIFFDNGSVINFIFLIIISPIIIYIYIRETKKLKINYSNYHKVDLYYMGKEYKFNAFLDTGNKLYDQYKKRPIVLIRTKKIKFNYERGILVPYMTASGSGVLKCMVIDKIIIDGKISVFKPVIGFMDNNLDIDGVDMILNADTMGGIYD